MSGAQWSGLVLVQDPSPYLSNVIGPFAGLPKTVLNTYLAAAVGALQTLIVTGQPITLMYGSGDGQKSVTYSRTSEPSLRNHIRELQKALGIGPGRRAIPVGF